VVRTTRVRQRDVRARARAYLERRRTCARALLVQVKIGSAERSATWSTFCNFPGVALRSMAVAPRQIALIHAGSCYFELDRRERMWRAMKSAGVIAVHQAGDFPGLIWSVGPSGAERWR